MSNNEPIPEEVMGRCSKCGEKLEYGSVEVESRLFGTIDELCIKCAAGRLGKTEAEIITLMDANDGEGTEVTWAETVTIDIRLKEAQP